MIQKNVKITNKGMISIPASLRKKYHLNDGDYVTFGETEEGTMEITPILSYEELLEQSPTAEEFKKVYEEARQIELDLEY